MASCQKAPAAAAGDLTGSELLLNLGSPRDVFYVLMALLLRSGSKVTIAQYRGSQQYRRP